MVLGLLRVTSGPSNIGLLRINKRRKNGPDSFGMSGPDQFTGLRNGKMREEAPDRFNEEEGKD
ncbi:hypothetical protein Droror1_Dr00017721, partial [Drosera rotundifolia]